MENIKNNEKYAIKVSNLKKQYRIGQIGAGTLTADLQSFWARLRGKEDPNIKIGQNQRLIGQSFMALDGINLTIGQGETVGIVGHNGAGKSTLLKLLSRVTAPTSGTIDINGRIASMLEVGTGFHGEMTGRENIYLNGSILGMTKAEIESKMEKIIEFSEIGEFIDTPVKRYSSGMFVKLAFSVAAHLDSEIMIMDEVLAVGDIAFQKKCLDKMREVANQEGRTVLYVSHNMNTIRNLCNRCIVLDQGKIIYDGSVEESINIYLNNNREESINNVTSLVNFERPYNSLNKVLMEEIEVLNNNYEIASGEMCSFKIKWKSLYDLKDIKFRVAIRYLDDSPVGMTTSKEICDVSSNEEYITEFSFDTTSLVEGTYFLNITLYQDNNKNANNIILDHISRAVSVKIINKSNKLDENALNSRHIWWGSVRFPECKIISNKLCN